MKNQPPITSPIPQPLVRGSKFKVQGSTFFGLPAILALALCGCAGTRPLRGGKAVTAGTPSGSIVQTLAQGENPSVPSRQAQETIKTRTYSVPNTPSLQYSITPVLLTEHEETRAHTELGAAQKDTARELGAKLSSLKSICLGRRRSLRPGGGLICLATAQSHRRQRHNKCCAHLWRRSPHDFAHPGRGPRASHIRRRGGCSGRLVSRPPPRPPPWRTLRGNATFA